MPSTNTRVKLGYTRQFLFLKSPDDAVKLRLDRVERTQDEVRAGAGHIGVRVLPPPPSPSPSDRWLELAPPSSASTASVRSDDAGSSSSCTAESEETGDKIR